MDNPRFGVARGSGDTLGGFCPHRAGREAGGVVRRVAGGAQVPPRYGGVRLQCAFRQNNGQ